MEEREFLVEIVKEAAKLIKDNLKVKPKGNEGDLVTNYDYEVEQFLIDKIKKKYPLFDIVSEEFNTDNRITDNCFTIDPIDGTVNFVNNFPLWCIQTSCIKNGKMCASVIYIPFLNEMYYADETGAYLNGEKLKVRKLPIKDCLYQVDGKIRMPIYERMSKYTRHFRNMASAGVGFSFVASGRLAATMFTYSNPWDYLPGVYLIEQAGGYVIEKEVVIGACSKEVADILYDCY